MSSISPYVDDLRKDAELCPKKILTEIKRRLKSKSFKQIHETDTISGLYDKEELKELREKYNLTGKSTFSYFLFKAKKREYSICCAIIDYTKCIIWIEDEVGDDAKIVSEPHQINFADESWENRWFGAIFKINEDIQILKK